MFSNYLSKNGAGVGGGWELGSHSREVALIFVLKEGHFFKGEGGGLFEVGANSRIYGESSSIYQWTSSRPIIFSNNNHFTISRLSFLLFIPGFLKTGLAINVYLSH